MRLAVSDRVVWAATGVFALVHVALAARLPIADDEAYYWLWSQRLAWGYPDHPPLIAVLVAVSARLFGTSPFGLRAVSILAAVATIPIVYLAARDLFDRETARRSTLIILGMPAMAVGTAFAFPDVPMALFWVLCLWTGWRALTVGAWWWLATGLATGLALLSKLTGFAFVLGLVASWMAGDWRRTLRDPWLYAGALVAIALFAPVVLWNAQHDWALVAVTLNRDPFLNGRSVPENLALFAVAQVGYYGFLAPALVGAGIVAARRAHPPVWRYLAWMTLPLLVVMTTAALDGRPKPHWPGPAYLSAAIALAALWPQWSDRAGLRRAAVALTALLSVGLVVVALLGWVQPTTGRWDRVAEAVDRQLALRPDQMLVLTETYHAGSLLSYYLRARVPVTSSQGAFVLWQEPAAWSGRTAVYVAEQGPGRNVALAGRCGRVMALEEVRLTSSRTVRLYRCERVRFP